jgi:C1A family cysteine protease
MELAANQSGSPEEFAATFIPFSRNFIYWNERAIEGDTSQDNGAQIRDGIKTLASVGACDELLWPYIDSLTFVSPNGNCFGEAANHKITSYQSLDNNDIVALKSCLAQGFPFVFGFAVFSSFESPSVASNGIVPMPQPYDQEKGGHAVLCVGYDDSKQAFIVRNTA